MSVTYLPAELLLVSSFAAQAAAHVRTKKNGNRAHVGIRPMVGSRLPGTGACDYGK